MNIKQILLGNWFGRFALYSREKGELIRTAISRPEAVGTVANDQLAGYLVASLCRSEKVFLDIGAHIGSVIAAVQNQDSTVHIIAVEAIPEKADRLRNKFPHVVLHACAVGEEDGETAFFVDTQRSGYSSLIAPESQAANTREIRVAIKRLDNLIPSNTDVDVIKMDIEGAEVGALRGATGIVSRCGPTVMFESAPTKSGSTYATRDLFAYFDERNYAIVVPNRLAHNDDGLSEAGFLESHLYPRRTTNYFAVHKDRRTEVRDRARKILGISVEREWPR